MKLGAVFVAVFLSYSVAFSEKNPLYEGFSFIEKGEYKNAFSTLSSIKSKSPVRLAGMGIAKYMLGDYKSAVSYLTDALKSKSEAKKWTTNYFTALSLFELRRYSDALLYFENVNRIKGDLPDVLFKMGVCYSKTGDIKSALTVLKKALELKPDFLEVYLEMVDIYEKQNLLEDAFVVIDAGLKIFPENAEIVYQRAKLLFKAGNLEEAEKALEKASKLTKNIKIQKLYSTIVESKKGMASRKVSKKDEPVRQSKLRFSSSSLIIISAITGFLLLIISGFYYKKRNSLDDRLLYIDELLKKGDIRGSEELLNEMKGKSDNLIPIFYTRYYVLKNDFNKALITCKEISDQGKRQILEGLILLYFEQKELFKKHLAILEAEGFIRARDFLKKSSFDSKEDVLSKIQNTK